MPSPKVGEADSRAAAAASARRTTARGSTRPGCVRLRRAIARSFARTAPPPPPPSPPPPPRASTDGRRRRSAVARARVVPVDRPVGLEPESPHSGHAEVVSAGLGGQSRPTGSGRPGVAGKRALLAHDPRRARRARRGSSRRAYGRRGCGDAKFETGRKQEMASRPRTRSGDPITAPRWRGRRTTKDSSPARSRPSSADAHSPRYERRCRVRKSVTMLGRVRLLSRSAPSCSTVTQSWTLGHRLVPDVSLVGGLIAAMASAGVSGMSLPDRVGRNGGCGPRTAGPNILVVNDRRSGAPQTCEDAERQEGGRSR